LIKSSPSSGSILKLFPEGIYLIQENAEVAFADLGV
jgi:hypothetical protein